MMATMLTREDRGPMTINTLLKVLQDNKDKLNKPIIMSSDEEGNEMLSLFGIEIDRKRKQITLYPAHL